MTTSTWTGKRVLGENRISALGFGCWAIGGVFQDAHGNPQGWGEVDDDESIRAIRRAVDLGVDFFDTADVYGAGHSERVLGRAIAGRRDDITIATKWGNTFDETTRTMHGPDVSVDHLRRAVHESLLRLGTDHIDLYQLHSGASTEEAVALREACEDLVTEGLIRGYAWSTDDPDAAALFATGAHCVAVQHECSVLHDAPRMLRLCDEHGLASVNRTPLAMGLLGARSARNPTSGADVRAVAPDWLRFFADGRPVQGWADRVDAVRDVLRSDGRTLAQGALAWLWARSDRTVPIPGFRTVAQAEENAAALEFGPLSPEQMREIETALAGRN